MDRPQPSGAGCAAVTSLQLHRFSLNHLQGVLRAFDATTLQQTYSSKQNAGRDDFGNLPVLNNARRLD